MALEPPSQPMTPGESGGPGGLAPADGERTRAKFGAYVADALRYWEPRRAIYNLVLLAPWWSLTSSPAGRRRKPS